jgi:hypothetical protein
MKFIMGTAVLTLAMVTPCWAQSSCVGSASLKTCTDDSGNSYTVSKFGNTTNVLGSSAGTGSTWSQTSSTFGNTTYTNGVAANGQLWNQTTSSIGHSTYTYGTDANGKPFSKTCTQFGSYTSCY